MLQQPTQNLFFLKNLVLSASGRIGPFQLYFQILAELVPFSFVLAASEAVADRRSSSQRRRWEAYARLYKKVSNEWWCEPGHGDWCTCLERYTLCRDGIYHKQDQFRRLLPTFIQVIDFSEAEEKEYWKVVSDVLEGKQLDSVSFKSERSASTSSMEAAGINNKVLLLRTILQWEEQLRSESKVAHVKEFGEITVVWWPDGEIVRFTSGSTAADAATRVGLQGKLVSVNGCLKDYNLYCVWNNVQKPI